MDINCEFGFLSIDSKKLYGCTVREKFITEKDQEIKEFKGVHKEGISHQHVQSIWFHSSAIDKLPQDLHNHFPILTHLHISRCDFKKITKNDLKGLEGLVWISIQNCKLSSLPNDLFTEMPNLKSVAFAGNKIKIASSNVLRPLLGRENVKVNLLKNKTIDACYWPGEENSLDSLEELMSLIDKRCLIHCDRCTSIVVPEPVISDPIVKELWITGKFSDFTIIGGDKEFKVHKNILAMNNEVFAQLLKDQKEGTEIKIAGFSSTSVEALLRFIYTNEISGDGNAKENFNIADKFKVAKMKSFYEKKFGEKIDTSKALEAFLFAHRLSTQQEKMTALKQIDSEFQKDQPKKLKDKRKITKVGWVGINFIIIGIIVHYLLQLMSLQK